MAQLPHSLDYIRQVVTDYFANKPVRRVEAFGSYAQDEATEESDLDLLLTMEQPVGWEFTDYAHDLEAQLGIKVDAGTAVSDYMMRYIKKDLQTLYKCHQKVAAGADLIQQLGPNASV